ncbi:MAG: hypothetical protein VX899_10010 [Myxococcota bacterium]|nr:hypothetical protein [Myxococcota bacterium]
MLFFLVTLLACGPSFSEVQKQDSIEAYEAYIAAAPSSPNAFTAKLRLEELYLEAAQEAGSKEGYDRYMEKYADDPEARLLDKAKEGRESFVYQNAVDLNTAEAWQAYMDEYPKGEKKYKQEARRRLEMLEYVDHIEIGAVEVVGANLAEDPDGPLDGFLITSDITNTGDKTVKSLNVAIQYLDAEGKVIETDKWPWVAPQAPGNLPIEEEWKVPVKPGETRTYTYLDTAPDAAGWVKKVKLVPTSITYVEE